MSNEVDIVIGAYERMKEIISINGDSTISALEYQNFVLSSSWHPWGKLYRKELFRNDVFDIPREIVHGEDAVMNIRVAFNCDKKIRFISSPIYHYYINEDGCCSTFNMNFLYLVKWYNQIHKSIPNDRVKDFLEELIILRLKYRNYILEYYIKNNIWRKHEFNRRLLQDIESCNFKLKASDKLLLACHNPISCFLYNMVINIYHTFLK